MEPQVNDNTTPEIPPVLLPVPSKKNSPLIIVVSTVLLLGLIGTVAYLAYQNFQLKKQLAQAQQSTTPTESSPSTIPTVLEGKPANLNHSPIVSNPLDTSSWKTASFNLIRPNAFYSPNRDTPRVYETSLTFTIPQNWNVAEEDKKTIEMQSAWTGEEGETFQYQTANYVISNPGNTLTIHFKPPQENTAEWYPLPSDVILVGTYVPSPSGGSALNRILRYKDLSSGKIRYASALSDGEASPLALDDEIHHWISLITDPLDSHSYGITYTIEMTYTGDDKDYDTDISMADQIVSLLVIVDRN